MLKQGAILFLCLAACACAARSRAATTPAGHPGPSAQVSDGTAIACPCPEPAVVELATPRRDHVLDAMRMLMAEARRCSDDRRVVEVRVVYDGASGQVVEARADDVPPAVSECVLRIVRRSCMPRFRNATFIIGFPLKVGPPYDDGAIGAPHCPPSAVASEDLDPQAAQARAREAYQARYGRACETEPEPHAALSNEPVRELDNTAKRPVLMTRIDEVERCYADALEGWPALQGKLELRVAIAPSGHVESTRVVSSSFPVPELGCCLRQVVQSLQFPAAADGNRMSATYDFAFRP
jgi:hypothetical protein